MSPLPLNEAEALVRANARLNEQEYRERRILLASYPKTVFLQLDAPCQFDCLFCSRPHTYRFFDLDEYRRNYEEKLAPVLERAERLNLTGSGELLTLPRAKEILGYFNRFACLEKMFATNGSSLTPKMADLLMESGNRYTLHVSLHASNKALHTVMTQSALYDTVVYNLRYIARRKRETDKLKINLVFVATTKNIHDLTGFVHWAADMGVDQVIVYYNFVYRMDQKELSCYFCKDKTNESFDMAQEAARRRGMRLSLPARFKQSDYAREQICNEAWSQVMINPEGDIITCDIAGDSRENLRGKDFMQVWNGSYYAAIRTTLAAGKHACSSNCLRANQSMVNDFSSHFITRGRTKEEIALFMEGT